jgi:hypothetical protein
VHDQELDELRDYRRREPCGNVFRRPETYGVLTSLEVTEPFMRFDMRGCRHRNSCKYISS